MVKPEDMDDIRAASLARDIAKKVEEDLVFPGQIKVTVIPGDTQCGVREVTPALLTRARNRRKQDE